MNRATHIGELSRTTWLLIWGVAVLRLVSAVATAGKAAAEPDGLLKKRCATLAKGGASDPPQEFAHFALTAKYLLTTALARLRERGDREAVGKGFTDFGRRKQPLTPGFAVPSHLGEGRYQLRARCESKCTNSRGGASATTQTAQRESGHLPAVRLDGNYFSREGQRFIPMGANWIPAKAAMEWPYEWDPKAIEADFGRMRELGFNTIRLDLVWAWFEPRPDDFNPEAFRQLDFLISLAHRYHIYLHPCFLIGGEVGEAYWDVPYRHGRNPQADPYMLRLETDFAAEFARRYSKETAILAWDLTDEPPFWIVDQTTDSMAINWTRLLTAAVRRHDSLHPVVVGTSMEDVGHGPFRPDNLRDEVDFFSVHPYAIYAPKLFPDPMLSARGTYGAALETALSGGAGHPVMVQEIGASSAQYEPEQIAEYLRANLYSALGAGANGFLVWCYTDAAPRQYHIVPYLRSPHETQFGLTTWEGEEPPPRECSRSSKGLWTG